MLRMLKTYLKRKTLKKARTSKEQAVQMKLANNSDVDVRLELFKNPDLFYSVLEHLVYDKSEMVRSKIAETIEDEVIIDDLIRYEKKKDILYKIACRQGLSAAQEIALIEKGDSQVNRRIAMNTRYKGIMIELSNSEDKKVRLNLTQNENMDYQISRILASDEAFEVRMGVAVDTPYKDILEILSTDPRDEVKIAVGENPYADQSVLYRLSKSSNEDVRAAVAGNENLCHRLKQKLKHDKVEYVRKQVID